jgi:hypothetical protein
LPQLLQLTQLPQLCQLFEFHRPPPLLIGVASSPAAILCR